MQAVTLPPLFSPPPPHSPLPSVPLSSDLPNIHLVLFRNVQNAKQIKELVIKGDAEVPECVLVNAAMILDIFQVQMACTKALLHQQQGIMRTRTLYSEILFNLSPTNNISDALRQFGISDTSSSLLCVMVSKEAPTEQIQEALASLIDGQRASLDELGEVCDLQLISKVYKTGTPTSDPSRILSLVIGAMALKGHLN